MQRSKAPITSWDDVRLLLTLTRARTVGEAATALAVDASTVSRKLAAMEKALGVSLFDRGRSGLTPTEAAEELVPVAEEIEAAIVRFGGAAEGLDRVATGVVRLACPPDVAEVFVVPILPALRARHPGLRLEIAPSEGLVDLSRREADLALRTVRPERGELVVTRLAMARWVLVASPKLARTLGALRTWNDAPWIGWGERMRGAPPSRWLASHAPEVDPVVRTDSLSLQLALLRSGIGVALAPEPSVQHFGLVPVGLHKTLRARAESWPTDELHLVTHRALANVPRVRAVWDALVARRTPQRDRG